MVSTDAAARGIDIPNVTRVIQADFAASAVDFLHRVSAACMACCCNKLHDSATICMTSARNCMTWSCQELHGLHVADGTLETFDVWHVLFSAAIAAC